MRCLVLGGVHPGQNNDANFAAPLRPTKIACARPTCPCRNQFRNGQLARRSGDEIPEPPYPVRSIVSGNILMSQGCREIAVMPRRLSFCLCLFVVAAVATFTSCSRDPIVRKQKYLHSGQRHFDEGKYREAAVEYVNAVKIDDSDGNAHYQLAKSYLKLQKWSDAFTELTRTVELQPENYRARVDLAKLLVATGNLKPAQEQSDLLLQQRPNDAQSHFIAGDLLAAEGKFPAAIAAVQQAISLDPNNSDLYLNLALMQMKNHQSEAAE